MSNPSEPVNSNWLAFFLMIKKNARLLDELEAQACSDGSRQ